MLKTNESSNKEYKDDCLIYGFCCFAKVTTPSAEAYEIARDIGGVITIQYFSISGS